MTLLFRGLHRLGVPRRDAHTQLHFHFIPGTAWWVLLSGRRPWPAVCGIALTQNIFPGQSQGPMPFWCSHAKNEYLWKISKSELWHSVFKAVTDAPLHFPMMHTSLSKPSESYLDQWIQDYKEEKYWGFSQQNHLCLSEVSSPLVVLPSTGGLRDESN